MLITIPDASLPDPGQAVYVLLALLAVIFYAMEGVGLGRIGRAGLDPVQLLLGASVVASVATLPIALWTGTFFVPALPFSKAESAVMLSGLANTVAYAGYVWMVGRGGPVFAPQVSYVVTGFGVLWSMVLLGENHSICIWSAFIIIIAGLFLTQPRPARMDSSPAARSNRV